MTSEAYARSGGIGTHTGRSGLSSAYFRLLVTLALAVAVASFIRDRGQLLTNVSFWPFLICFLLTVWRVQAGFLATMFLLTITPSIHEQLNVLAGPGFHAWAYPGVDCALGFLAAWVLRGGLDGTDEILSRIPSGRVLLFHAWMVLSAAIVIARNLWQSASEFSLRGLAFNAWLARGITWHDDYYPIQDPFFYAVAVAMLFSTWALLSHAGHPLLRRLVGVVLVGASANVLFVAWQKLTGKGWVNGQIATSANAFWPDLHSFGVFMAMALFLSYGLWKHSETRPRAIAAGLAVLVSATGLYWSGSRSTLLFVAILLVGWAIWSALKRRGCQRAIALVAASAVVGAVHWMLERGYRGLSYANLEERLTHPDPESLNIALSHRPEIWDAALRMYSTFPFFGLGQGAFYRLSIIPDFSGSKVLIGLGGDGVHNEFLRILVELGPVGLGLFLLVLIPFARLGSQNFRWLSFYALLGIAIGCIYTNAILVRELLLLAGVFAGSYFWESSSASPSAASSPGTVKVATVFLAALAVAGLIEVVSSFGRYPYTYGQRCLKVRPLAKDGWTQGVLRLPVPPEASSVDLLLLADRPDLARRAVDLDVSVLSGSLAPLAAERHVFTRRVTDPTRIRLHVPNSPDGKRFLELKASNCFVPLNLGITYDPRHLGVRVQEMRFATSAGAEAR
jgi:O-antigen ligase